MSKRSKKPMKTDYGSDLMECWIKNVDLDVKRKLNEFKDELGRFLIAASEVVDRETNLIENTYGSVTFDELKRKRFSVPNFYSTLMSETLNKSNKKRGRKQVEDEGYLTAVESLTQSSTKSRHRSQSSDLSTTAKKDRARAKCNTATKKRQSRSLSRSKINKTVTIKVPESYKTPSNQSRIVNANCGYITPKVKPDAPIAFLRHPMQGEMAMSMQGSPLLINSIVTERCPNVNIPMLDGRVMSLQPKRLRVSQIPNLDEDTRMQLKTLRDNLDQVVNLSRK